MSAPSFCLLIADDEYWVRENLKNLLDWEKLSIRLIEPAVDGEDAVARIEAEQPDILITDINMPFVSGNEVIRFAKKRNPKVAVIVVSGYSDFVFVRDALLSGAVDYLLKPITKSSLLDTVKKAIAALGNDRAYEHEKADIEEKLLRASSVLRDRELSARIAGEEPEAKSEDAVSDLDLTFAGFTLVLIKLVRFPTTTPRNNPRLSQEIKSTVARIAEGSIVFQNLYVRNEIVVLTAIRGDKLARVCRELPGTLKSRTGFQVAVGVSRFHYSFADLRAAYEEARLSLAMSPISGDCYVAYVEEAEKTMVRNRVTDEQENRLLFGLQSGNKKLIREVIFDEIGLGRCEREKWLLAEIRQTAEYLAALIFHHASPEPSAVLAMENLSYLLDAALETLDEREMCSLLDQALDEAIDDPPAPGASDSMKQTIRQVQRYIEERYFNHLSLSSIAAHFRVERSYLSKAFKQQAGLNLMLAIAKARIEKAQEYIRGEGPDGRDLSLADISCLVGYDEYAYFNRVFRKIAGTSPSEYKAAVQSGEPK